MNTWQFIDGDIILSSDDEEQLQMANAWIANLVEAIRLQTMEELQNGRSNISDNESTTTGYEQPELSEVPC